MAKLTERVAVCETEITYLKDSVKRVCENEIPHINLELGKIATFLESIKPVFQDVKEIKTNIAKIRNQEKLGGKEKAAIIIAIITSIASIAIAYLK